MKNLQKHFYLIVLFHFLLTGCGNYSSDEDTVDRKIKPIITSISPSEGETNVEVTTSISLQFSKGIKTNSVTTNDSNTNCSGTVQISTDNFSTCTKMSSVVGNSDSNKTFTVTPESNLNETTNYHIKVTNEIMDDSGNSLSGQFTTSQGFTTKDITPPTIVTISPSDNESSVSVGVSISITFSETMDTSSVTTNTSDTSCSGSLQITLDNFGSCIQMSSSPSITNSNKTFTIKPSSNLFYNKNYKIRVTTVVKDLSGISLSSQYETLNGFISTGLFLAVGSGVGYGINMYSFDGINWLSRDGSWNYFHGTAFGNNLFAIIGFYGAFYTSTDGNYFTHEYSFKNGSTQMHDIIYANEQFLTVGESGYILTSSDGKSWTKRSSEFHTFYGVTYGDSLYVSVGWEGIIVTSTDSISWTSRTSGTSNNLNGITYGNGLYVTVGRTGTILTSSDNGTTWDNRTSGTTNNLWGVTYGNGIYVVVGGGTILTSSDGITWIIRSTGGGRRVIYRNELFVTVGGKILTSTDGISWTTRVSSGSFYGVDYTQ